MCGNDIPCEAPPFSGIHISFVPLVLTLSVSWSPFSFPPLRHPDVPFFKPQGRAKYHHALMVNRSSTLLDFSPFCPLWPDRGVRPLMAVTHEASSYKPAARPSYWTHKRQTSRKSISYIDKHTCMCEGLQWNAGGEALVIAHRCKQAQNGDKTFKGPLKTHI